ncbi:hypothetical protein TetV_283 [Tetraselmis virus 1]|uniref:Uncharacterized protein n=1 Tax=Tetraselmis virus 1 TaxID=2060617 RepID=A0A2P0VN95_9VIRU|nr:hypothetical protein QJ968_gp283 [Tetraselmis virus 1]AUF82375.1 hypothetical protein TetV_283 [Tetraselmis virus 1]
MYRPFVRIAILSLVLLPTASAERKMLEPKTKGPDVITRVPVGVPAPIDRLTVLEMRLKTLEEKVLDMQSQPSFDKTLSSIKKGLSSFVPLVLHKIANGNTNDNFGYSITPGATASVDTMQNIFTLMSSSKKIDFRKASRYSATYQIYSLDFLREMHQLEELTISNLREGTSTTPLTYLSNLRKLVLEQGCSGARDIQSTMATILGNPDRDIHVELPIELFSRLADAQRDDPRVQLRK